MGRDTVPENIITLFLNIDPYVIKYSAPVWIKCKAGIGEKIQKT